jgi:hypothetical protein
MHHARKPGKLLFGFALGVFGFFGKERRESRNKPLRLGTELLPVPVHPGAERGGFHLTGDVSAAEGEGLMPCDLYA